MDFRPRNLFFALISYKIIICASESLVSNPQSTVLRISTAHFEPYMYLDEDGQFYNGIEYNIVKFIGKELKMDLKFQATEISDICSNVVLK